MIISPSLLSCDFTNIEKELNYFSHIDNVWFHLDIMDGHFVPNFTLGGPLAKQIVSKTKLPIDAHIMVSNPEFHGELLKDTGIHNLTFHLEATDNPLELIKKFKGYFKSVGISIKPNTPVSSISLEVLKAIDLLLIMSVEPGFGGQSFIESTYNKMNDVVTLKKNHDLSFMVQIDGGVNNLNSTKLKDHGANNLVAGSYIFKDGPSNYEKKLESLRS